MSAPPTRDEIAGTPTNEEAKAGFGKLWDYVTGLLGASGDPAAARTAMGLVELKSVTASVASNALTVTLNPTTLDFRSATLGSGTVNARTITTAISAVVPSGATLGTTSAVAAKVMLLAIDNAGTVELAVCNGSLALDESALISTTVLDAASDSASVIYSATARTSVPFRIVGYVESTQATAGTWATSPSKIQGAGFLSGSLNGDGDVGLVGFFAMNTAPSGWLKANGALVSRTTYATLFAAIGTTFGVGDGSTTFALPDMRGYFPRGWVDNGSVDSGRAFGSTQADAFASHTHAATQRSSTAGAAASYATIGSGAVGPGSISLESTGGAETRPKNVALLACIKF